MQKYHIWTRLMLVQKRQNPRHQHDQWSRQNVNKNWEKSTYQRTWSQIHHHQTHHPANMIRPMTANTANLKAIDAIKIRSIGNTRNRAHKTHH